MDQGVEIRAGAIVHKRRDAVLPGQGIHSAALDLSHAGERVRPRAGTSPCSPSA